MPECRFFLLGRFSALVGDRPMDLPAGPARTMLKILLTNGKAAESDLARWLAPRPGPARSASPLPAAAAAVQAALTRACPGAALERAGPAYSLVLPADAWIDVAAMRAWVESGRSHEQAGDLPSALAAYQEAECLFLGDLLEEEGNTEWVLPTRRTVRREYVAVLEAMARCWRSLGNEGYADGFQAKARSVAL